MLSLLLATPRIIAQRMVRAAQFSCCSAKLHFFNSYDQAAQ